METSYLLFLLNTFIKRNSIILLKFTSIAWQQVKKSTNGINQFTTARERRLCDSIEEPSICLISTENHEAYIALITSCRGVSTLESRLKIKLAQTITPFTKKDLANLLSDRPHLAKELEIAFESSDNVVSLPAYLSENLVDKLAAQEKNIPSFQKIVESLSQPTSFQNKRVQQAHAIKTALDAFGITPSKTSLKSLEVYVRDSALSDFASLDEKEKPHSLLEDSAIEHEARTVPNHKLVGSSITGKAIFENRDATLEVVTANKRPLEQVFGVDLIYINETRKNVVMLQYKMLEPVVEKNKIVDWIYKPDKHLKKEIDRMKKFTNGPGLQKNEYRLNDGAFYLKFLKRDGSIDDGGIILSLDHFERLQDDNLFKTKNGSLRISYKTLDGRYLRYSPFVNLISSGYIGSYEVATKHLKTIIEATLKNGKSIVAAIQKNKKLPPMDDDKKIRTIVL